METERVKSDKLIGKRPRRPMTPSEEEVERIVAGKPATWGQRLPCPCGQPGYLTMMNYDGWFRVECHAGNGCDNFGASDFRKDAVERWNEHVRSGADYRLPTSQTLGRAVAAKLKETER